jgi:hypothetical protein
LRSRGGNITDANARTRLALTEQQEAGDIRRYVASAPAFVEILGIDAPAEALELAIDATERAIQIGDFAGTGNLVIAICDTALEAENDAALARWLPELATVPLDATRQLEANLLVTTARAARSRVARRVDAELIDIADAYLALGDVSRSDMPEIAAICSLVWIGRSRDARELFEDRVRGHLPSQLAIVYELVLRAVEGEPWRVDDLEPPSTTLPHYERALLHLLRNEPTQADELFRERLADRKRIAGGTRQRFSPHFPGALVAALGPRDTDPDIPWLIEWIVNPTFPGMWIVHRAICALLLAEREHPPVAGLEQAAIRLLDSSDADDAVRRWIYERAERSGA